MITPKDYQLRVLASLRDFLKRASRGTPLLQAFQEVLLANDRPPAPYIPVAAAGLRTEMPYVCLRVPTGGGKTLLASFAVGIVKDELLHAERAVVLWLVPSNTILDQTADALRDPQHPYRRALKLSCMGPVEVVTIEEALSLSRATVDGQTVVIVATIQAFRVEDTTGRKVYEQNSAYSDHLLNVPADRVGDLLPGADGKPKPSLVNILRLRRPIVIVDEAHNARTDLSFATLGNVLPSCIIEFTATPARTKSPSNVLHHVSAAELKAADMVKLPLRVVARVPSQKDALFADAITLRGDLERLAAAETQATGEYLRPILLIQAENVDACEPLRERMVTDFGILRDEVKISVGSNDELKNVRDISTAKNNIRYILTVQKLREGWDCPFAYVLCSLKETRSSTAIEQIVGRILRLPGAKAKQHPDLNCAYAFSLSPTIHDVLSELRNALESNGFTAAEAERIIIPVHGHFALGSQPKTVTLVPGKQMDVAVAQTQVAALGGKVRLNAETGALTIFVPLTAKEAESLAKCATTPEAKQQVREAVEMVREAERAFGGSGEPRQPSPYERQLDFLVPLLCVCEDGELFEFEQTFLLEHPWKLSAKNAELKATYNPLLRPLGRSGLVDVSMEGRVTTNVVAETPDADFVGTLHQQVLQLGGGADWTAETLIAWLDKHIDHSDITFSESAEFLRKVLNGLMAKYELADVSMLALDRFRLRDEVESRIQEHRDRERGEAFKGWLLPDSSLTVSDDKAINFKTTVYEPSWLYEGGYQFKKHYFGPKPGELREKRADGKLTEEFKCAQFLDGLPQVKFWTRNLSRRASSFRLQTSTDWFYPDFVAMLGDERVLVVEYKGKHLLAESADKAAVGAVWASRSKGRCLFVMPTDQNFAAITTAIG